MNPFTHVFLNIMIALIFYILGATSIEEKNKKESCKIDLPEEYKLITPNDTLKGYFDSSRVLHIEFNNQRNK